MIFNIILIILTLFSALLLFTTLYISENKRTDIYTEMEEKEKQKLEGKSPTYVLIHNIIFNLL